MAKNHVNDGDVVDYTNAGTALASGDPVVIGNQIGVALVSIANGATGSVAMSKVWNLPKADAAVIAVGEKVLFDSSAGNFDDSLATPAAGDVSGCCVAMESKGVTVGETIAVKLNVGVGTVT